MAISVEIKPSSGSEPKGVHVVSFPPGGLALQKSANAPIVIPVGTAAKNDGQSVHVTHQGQGLQLRVLGVTLYNQNLAAHLAAYLNGHQGPPDADQYKMPIYLFILTLIPIGIPILTLGGAIPGMIGGGLWFACLMIAKQPQIPAIARALIILLITVAGFGATIVLLGGLALLQMK